MPDSRLENYPVLQSAGPGPGTPVVQEMVDATITVWPLAYWGISGDDGYWINLAHQMGKRVHLLGMSYNVVTQITVPVGNEFLGVRGQTILSHTGGGTCVYSHDPIGPPGGFGSYQTRGCRIQDLIIDGTGAGPNAIGFDFGDQIRHKVDIETRNYSGAGQIGHNFINRFFYTERGEITVMDWNNSQGPIFDVVNGATPAEPSFEFNRIDINVLKQPGQNGIIIQNGAYMAGKGSLSIGGNFVTSNTPMGTAMLTVRGAGGSPSMNSHIAHTELFLCPESDLGLTFAPTPIVFGSTSNSIHDCWGCVFPQGTGWQASNPASGQFTIRGCPVGSDPTLTAPVTPSVPASGALVTNTQSPAVAWVSGGAVTGVEINGQATGLTSGAFYLCRAGTIRITYTVAPTWVWTSAIGYNQ